MRGTARDEQIHRHDGARAIVDLCVTDERAASNRASAHGYDNLRRSNGVVCFLERQFHILRHRAGDEQSVGVAR